MRRSHAVCFRWDGEGVVRVYSLPSVARVHVEHNPRVALNSDGDRRGGDIIVLSGRATVDRDAAPADRDDACLAKYRAAIDAIGLAPASVAEEYSVAMGSS